MPQSSIRPAVFGGLAILSFLTLAATVIVMRLSTDETADNRLNPLTFGPTLNEAMGRGWQEVSWGAVRPPNAEAASFRQGVLFLDVLTALRARQRAITTDLLHLLEEACSENPDQQRQAAREEVLAEIASVRAGLEDRQPFDAAREQLLALEPRLRLVSDPESFRLGLFLEQGRLTFEHGKMPPRSWERELTSYLATPTIDDQLRNHLEELQSIPTRSGKMKVLQGLLSSFGDGTLGFTGEQTGR